MTEEWKTKVLKLTHRTTEVEDLEFVSLVEMAMGNCDLDTCRVLIRTFVTDDDYGVQESVVSVLSSAKTEDYQLALVEDLPRLANDAPEWADVLLERELSNNPDALHLTLDNISPQAKVYYESYITLHQINKS